MQVSAWEKACAEASSTDAPGVAPNVALSTVLVGMQFAPMRKEST